MHMKCNYQNYSTGCPVDAAQVCRQFRCRCNESYPIEWFGRCLPWVSVNGPCFTSKQCSEWDTNSRCYTIDDRFQSGTCLCLQDYYYDNSTCVDSCVKRVAFGEKCQNSDQCFHGNSVCDNTTYRCRCGHNYTYDLSVKRCRHNDSYGCAEDQEWVESRDQCVAKHPYMSVAIRIPSIKIPAVRVGGIRSGGSAGGRGGGNIGGGSRGSVQGFRPVVVGAYGRRSYITEGCDSGNNGNNGQSTFFLVVGGVLGLSLVMRFPKLYPIECVEYALDYKPVAGDRILVTIPRSGTFWTQYVVMCLTNGGRVADISAADIDQYFLEGKGPRARTPARCLTGADITFLCTHCVEVLSKREVPGVGYLLVIRNPKDALVSLYRMLCRVCGVDLDFGQVLADWMAGRLSYGDRIGSIKRLWLSRHRADCTLLVYERMLADPAGAIKRVARFLGPDYERRLTETCPDVEGEVPAVDETLLDRTLRLCSIRTMRDKFTGGKHVVSGGAGGWRSMFSRQQSDDFDRRVRDEWSGTGLDTLWEREMRWSTD
ncbi:unnamed protein product [Medioppia subpectinata]|uniref:EGF-like domain-containing protein n=1 Tax=Medioppia subpectinata TaxID=1979941 RepID=A0A7R9Q6Y1_9ACAR|nr:unnamed protein product [Medioppia subpectinata]CAG2114978.1 unnamed protein product [Medioppia subpectinata]